MQGVRSIRGDYKDSFLHETFYYRIMFHTDLSRYSGMSRSGQNLKKFDWGLYDLVVIDESHNFRETLIKAFPTPDLRCEAAFSAANSCASAGGSKEVLWAYLIDGAITYGVRKGTAEN